MQHENEQNILIDQLEDQLIDHPDASTTKQLSESSYDETFQKKLNARADQFYNESKWKQNGNSESGPGEGSGPGGSSYYQFLVTKPYLDYEYSEMGNLKTELGEWFASSDFANSGMYCKPNKDVYEGPVKLNCNIHEDSNELNELLYHILGGDSKADEQLEQIQLHSGALVKDLLVLFSFLEKFFSAIENYKGDTSPSTLCDNYFKILTITYFVVNVGLVGNSATKAELRKSLREVDLLTTLVSAITLWKRDPHPKFRTRNLLLLLWKLLLLEFGDLTELKAVDALLVEKHDIKEKDRKNSLDNRLTCSPLDYFTFRENLIDKYPMFADTFDTQYEQTPDIERNESHQNFMAMNSFSNSLSNLLELPRTNKAHTVLGQLPIQTLHIATPVPSPPSTPSDFMTGGEKIRKLYHVNQGMPFIYPTNGINVVPEAVTEANQLLQDAVYESYSNKRLWTERQRYMSQERGNMDQYGSIVDELDHGDDDSGEIRLLSRVEEFYSKNLTDLHALVEVLVETVKSNKHDFSLRDAEQELDPDLAFSERYAGPDKGARNRVRKLIVEQFEVLRLKETALKASSSIMILLLKWFKASHVLKYYYFSSLLFDEQYLAVFIDFMANSFNNSDLQESEEVTKNMPPYEVLSSQNKLMNPSIDIPELNFFDQWNNLVKEPGKIELINKTPISDLPPTVDENNQNIVHITKYNENFCFILSNLLNVTNKVLIKNISQRIFVLNETKPTDLLKIVLLNYINDSLRLPILKIFKKLIPYQGRKWRALNMDVISQIYLNLKLSLKDNWLSGRDLESDFNNSFDQEIALRSLLQFYNVRRYPEQMESLGYAVSAENIPTVDFEDLFFD